MFNQKLKKPGAVPLGNCLSLADRLRIAHAIENKRSVERTDSWPYRYGQVIIAKAFLGSCQQTSDMK